MARWSMALVAICLAACDDGSIGPAVTALGPASHEPFFPIASGIHGGLDCKPCHGSFDTFLAFTCLEGCHWHEQARMDPAHAGIAGYLYESTACLGCHPRGTGAAPAEHELWFAIGEGSDHSGQACKGCHTTPGDRSVVTCEGTCHTSAGMESSHVTQVNVRGFEHGTPACLLCHAGESALRIAQHRPFRIASGDHARSTCQQCHPQLRVDKPYDTIDFRAFGCLNGACHDDRAELADHHDDEDDYRYESAACEDCHPRGVAEDD